jgi:putative aminopeptidase FrvX
VAPAALHAAAAGARAQSLDSLVLRLAGMSAVTGLEDAMAESLLAMLPGAASDRAGNVVWSRGSGEPVRAAMCPMDEVGYVVGGIRPDGYLTLRRVGATNVGPLYDQFLEGHRVMVFGRRGAVPGVVGVRSTHLTRGRPPGPDTPFSLDDAFVDVGAASEAQVAALGIEVLAPVTRAKRAHRYGNGLVAAPNVAARAACAALLSAARGGNPGSGTTIVAFVRRRHFNHDGAGFLLYDHAGLTQARQVVLLGGVAQGASLHAGPLVGTETVNAGTGRVTVTTWSLPARYPRTPVESVSLNDVNALATRLEAFLGGRP